MNVRVGRSVSMALPDRAADLHTQLNHRPASFPQNPFESLAELRSILTEHAAIVAQEATGENGSPLSEMLAIGVCEPGRVTATEGGLRGYVGLIDAAQLADLSGVNVVDGFPARDIVSGGKGGPLSPLSLWILFRSAHCDRIFLHLGRTARLVRLPRLTGSLSSVSGLAFRMSQGMALVDLLVSQLTGGRRQFDPGGRLAVQGRRLEELVDHWLTLSEPLQPPSEGDAPDMLRSAVSMAVDGGWSVYDMLCSATHFVADSVARSAERLIRSDSPTEVVLSGGGLSNGLVLRHLSARLSGHSLLRIEELGGEPNVIPPAIAAILALLHLDQVPANVAGLTGAEIPRVLGRLTPGGPQAWQRLLAGCAAGSHSIRPLRAAL